MRDEIYKKCEVCGKEFQVTRRNSFTCSEECYQKYVDRWNEERRKRIYPEIECDNRIPDQSGRSRCKATGYLCNPTERKPWQRFHCIFEPRYMKNKRVQNVIKIAKTIKPGMRVTRLIRTAGSGYVKYNLESQSMIIKEIYTDGRLLLEVPVNKEKYPYAEPELLFKTISDFYDVLYVDGATFKRAMEAAVDNDVQEEGSWTEKEIYE